MYMSVIVELNAGIYDQFSKESLHDIAMRTIVAAKKISSDVHNITISVAIVDEKEIQRVNQLLRGKNQTTDVISIGDYSDDQDISRETKNEVFLGEIILCYNYIVESAQERKISISEEFYLVFVHGILHLLGFQHGQEMFYMQEIISKEFCTKNNI